MTLTADDRKNLSKKYVVIPDENIAFQINADNLDALIVDFENLDGSYKSLFDNDNDLIALYHPELDLLDGNIRTSIVEQDIQDSANKVLGNFFFPNDTQTSTPSLPDGVWKELKAFAKSSIVGKNYSEVFGSQDSELDKISAVTTLTTSIFNDYTQSERQGNTPPAGLITDLASLKTAVDEWELWLTDQKTALQANTDPTQTTEITAAIADIDLSLTEILAWEALTDLAVGGKVDDPGLQVLDDESARRSPFIPSRIAEIEARLGDVTQNSDGSIASQSGLYAGRYINLDLRLNLAEGTLSKQKGLELGKRVQTENIANNNDTLTYLTDSVLVASKLAIDADGSDTIEVLDGTLFSISDTVYVVSDNQVEVSATITNISSNTITLDTTISTIYTVADVARLLREV